MQIMKYCTACGSQNLDEAHFCEKCGNGFQFQENDAISDKNAYVGKTCPFCQYPIKPGEMVTVCPACGVPHHAACWIENGNSCTTFGCTGQKQESSVQQNEFYGNYGAPGSNRNHPLPDNSAQSDVRENVREECAPHIPEIEEAQPQSKRKGLLIAVAVVLIAAGCGVYSFIHQDKIVTDKPVNNSKVATKNNNIAVEEKKVITKTGSIKGNDVIVRGGPSTISPAIDYLYNGNKVKVLNEQVCKDENAAIINIPSLTIMVDGIKVVVIKGQAVEIINFNGGYYKCQTEINKKKVYISLKQQEIKKVYGETWYQIQLDNNKIGWVYSDYIEIAFNR